MITPIVFIKQDHHFPRKRYTHLLITSVFLFTTLQPASAAFDFGPSNWLNSSNNIYRENGRIAQPNYGSQRTNKDRWRNYDTWDPNYWRYRFFDNDSGPNSRMPNNSMSYFPSSFRPGYNPQVTPFGNHSNQGYRPNNRQNNDFFDNMPFIGGNDALFDDMPFMEENDFFDDMPFMGNDDNNYLSDNLDRFNFDVDIGFDKNSRNDWNNDYQNHSNGNQTSQSRAKSNSDYYNTSSQRHQNKNSLPNNQSTFQNSYNRQPPIRQKTNAANNSRQYNPGYRNDSSLGIDSNDNRYNDQYWRNYSNHHSNSGSNQSSFNFRNTSSQPPYQGRLKSAPYQH